MSRKKGKNQLITGVFVFVFCLFGFVEMFELSLFFFFLFENFQHLVMMMSVSSRPLPTKGPPSLCCWPPQDTSLLPSPSEAPRLDVEGLFLRILITLELKRS